MSTSSTTIIINKNEEKEKKKKKENERSNYQTIVHIRVLFNIAQLETVKCLIDMKKKGGVF
jgi:hypothetical protein